MLKNSERLKEEIEIATEKITEVLKEEIEEMLRRKEKKYQSNMYEEEIKLKEQIYSIYDYRVIGCLEKYAEWL